MDNTLKRSISQYHSEPKNMSISICEPKIKQNISMTENQLINEVILRNDSCSLAESSLAIDNIGNKTVSYTPLI